METTIHKQLIFIINLDKVIELFFVLLIVLTNLNFGYIVTGASFIALNGDLEDEASTRWRIVEDGVMVEMSSQKIALLRDALRLMKDFELNCGTNDEQTVIFHWTEDDVNFNIG